MSLLFLEKGISLINSSKNGASAFQSVVGAPTASLALLFARGQKVWLGLGAAVLRVLSLGIAISLRQLPSASGSTTEAGWMLCVYRSGHDLDWRWLVVTLGHTLQELATGLLLLQLAVRRLADVDLLSAVLQIILLGA